MKNIVINALKANFWVIAVPFVFCLILFSGAIFADETLFHMDWAPYFPRSNWIGPWQHFVVRGMPLSVMHLMKACLPLRFYHVAFYIVCICGTVWTLYAYLRDRCLSMGAAFMGGIAFGFSGYCVSLVSAGHRGVFEACLSAATLLFAGSRAIRRRKWYYYAISALAIALVIGTQPDVFLILLVVVGPFLAVDFIHEWRTRSPGFGRQLSLGVLVFAIALTIFGWRGAEKIVTGFLPRRDALIQQSSASSANDEGKLGKWIFCTNWSLPPSDSIELAVPLIMGIESTDRELPFWGELGRSYDWEPGKPGFPNYRQHTIYAGGVQLVLALYMMVVLLRMPKSSHVPDRALLITASVLVGVTFVLALGRYTPFYRLFYALPLASSIRCPIKFLHATNLAGSILCAFGSHTLVRRIESRREHAGGRTFILEPEGITLVCAALAIVAFVLTKVTLGDGSTALAQTWASLGFDPEIQKALLDRFHASLDHAILIFLLAAAPFVCMAMMKPGTWCLWMPWAFAMLTVVDMTTVNIHYVNTVDLSIHEMKNVMVEDMIADQKKPPRVLDLLTGGNPHHPIRANLEYYYSQDIVLVDKEQRGNPAFAAALQEGGRDFYEALARSDVTYIVAPPQVAAVIQKQVAYNALAAYGFDGRRFIRTEAQHASVVVLVRAR